LLGRLRRGDASVFELVWLVGWAAGAVAVGAALLWLRRGRIVLTVGPTRLEVRKELGPFARVREYDAALAESVEGARVPADDDERPRSDYGLVIGLGESTVFVGEGLDERRLSG
jgi:hypothetical protein